MKIEATVSSKTMLLEESIDTLREHIQRGDVTCESLTQASLETIASQNDELRAFITVGSEQALATAMQLDERRKRGESLGPLAGIPIGVKDNLCTIGLPTTAGSRMLCRDIDDEGHPIDPWQSPYDATVVARLRQADAILIGKTNLDEFAMGSSTENSAFGPSRNPWARDRCPGGSSGGSAVAIAAGMVPVSLGSDTGGSVRQPASFTGTVGLKPTYGRLSRYGLIAFGSSLDQVGPLGRDVPSTAVLFDAIAGPDSADATSANVATDSCRKACDEGVDGLTIGIPEEYFGEGLEAEVEHEVRKAISALEHAGASIVPVALPHTRHAVAAYYVVATAECSSNLSRFDGIRFGYQAEPGSALTDLYELSRDRGFGSEVRRRIMLGTYVLSAGYYEAHYRKAQRVRTLIRQDFSEAQQTVDLIATPVSPTTAFKLGERTDDPLSMYLADVYTLPASLAGLPAMSVPCGLGAASHLPVGIQLIGRPFEEPVLFRAARAIELATSKGAQRPPASA